MAYVGTPLDTTNAFQSLAGKRFNGDASTTAFTLDSAPNSTLDIEVFIENVRQDPNSAYTVSGTTLTFTSAPPSGTNNIYVVHQAKAVGTIDPAVGSTLDLNGAAELVLDADADTTITADTDDQIDIKIAGADDFQFTANTFTAASGSSIVTPTITLNTTGTTALSSLAASQWRVTANFTGDAAPIASNWEVSDSTGYGSLGSAMTESSGIFTFPSTGIYLVLYQGTMTSNSSENECGFRIQVTTDNSSYDAEGEAVASGSPGGSNETGSAQTAAIVDVTNTTNVKVRFAVFQADDSNTTVGSSTRHLTGATFIRLGDT